jgi:hypothetical protein
MPALFPIPLDTVLKQTGGLAAGAQVRVLQLEGSSTVPAYSSPDSTTPVTQPIIANAAGRIPAHWTPAGAWRLLITGGEADRTIPITVGVADKLSSDLADTIVDVTEFAEELDEKADLVAGVVPDTQLAGNLTKLRIPDAIMEYPWSGMRATFVADHGRTYACAVSRTGEIVVSVLNHASGTVVRRVVGQAIVDDHCMPALYVANGRRSVVAWTNHNADSVIHLRTSGINGIDGWGTDIAVSTGSAAISYSRLIRISALSTATQDVFYLFTRHRDTSSGTSWFWRVRTVTVDQATGNVQLGAAVSPFGYGNNQGYGLFEDSTNGASQQVIRCYLTYNPQNANSALHRVSYLEMNAVTGAVTNDHGTVLGNTGLGSGGAASGMPIDVGALTPAINKGSGFTVRLLAGRDGLGGMAPAFLCADWATADLVATYKLLTLRTFTQEGLRITTGGARAPAAAAANPAPEWIGSVATLTPAANQVFEGRWRTAADGTGAAVNERGWQFVLMTDGKLRYSWSSAGTATDSNRTSSVACPAGTNGFRATPNMTTGTVVFETSTDGGATWAMLGVPATGGATGLFSSPAPLSVGSLNGTSIVGVCRSITVRDGATVIASQDFVAGGWTSGQTAGATDADPQGNTWTLFGNSTVQLTGWETLNLGDAGIRIGGVPAANYLAGGAFPSPALDDQVVLQRYDGTQTTLTRQWPDRNIPPVEMRSPTAGCRGRYAPVRGGGPIAGFESDITRYEDFTDYASDLVAIAA